MAKTTKEFLQNERETAKRNAGKEAEGAAPTAPTAMPFVPDEGAVEAVPEVSTEPHNPADLTQEPVPSQPQ